LHPFESPQRQPVVLVGDLENRRLGFGIDQMIGEWARLVGSKLPVCRIVSGDPVTKVYFPYSGIVSLVVELEGGDMVEAAMVGRDGVVNAASALDGRISLCKAIVQMSAFIGAVPVPIIAAVADQHRDLRSLFIRHEQVLLAQSQQSGACNASHVVEARLCRWLLRTRDLVPSDDLPITQEFLGQMLGVQRTSISIVAGALQKAGLIRYRRGNIKILDLDGLQEGACECYETVKGHYDHMLSPLHAA
jgi:CRP-like cAMP-binding protein